MTGGRLQLAAQHLKTGDSPVKTIADPIGYEPEAAFGRAFKRRCRAPPGEWPRRQAEPFDGQARERDLCDVGCSSSRAHSALHPDVNSHARGAAHCASVGGVDGTCKDCSCSSIAPTTRPRRRSAGPFRVAGTRSRLSEPAPAARPRGHAKTTAISQPMPRGYHWRTAIPRAARAGTPTLRTAAEGRGERRSGAPARRSL